MRSESGSGRRLGRNTEARSAGSELRIELRWCRRRDGGEDGSTGGRAGFSEGGGWIRGGGGWSALSLGLGALSFGPGDGWTTNANGLAFERGFEVGVSLLAVVWNADSNRGVASLLCFVSGVVKPSGPDMTRRRFGGRGVLIAVLVQVAD